MSDELECPWCDDYSFPDTQRGRNARVDHLYEHHDPPLDWAARLEAFDAE